MSKKEVVISATSVCTTMTVVQSAHSATAWDKMPKIERSSLKYDPHYAGHVFYFTFVAVSEHSLLLLLCWSFRFLFLLLDVVVSSSHIKMLYVNETIIPHTRMIQ